MAGGIGSRFWPLSKDNYPKQFLDILGTGKSFIRSTYERFSPVIPDENFLVVTNKAYKQLVLEHLPMLRPDQVLCEPARRNTAPCIAYAAYHIQSRCQDANIVVTPADHLVTNEVEFQRIIRLGFDFLAKNQNALMTIGIKPSRPETGYGYIQVPKQNTLPEVVKVEMFKEKPDYDWTALCRRSSNICLRWLKSLKKASITSAHPRNKTSSTTTLWIVPTSASTTV